MTGWLNSGISSVTNPFRPKSSYTGSACTPDRNSPFGSAQDADHIVGELMKGFKLKPPLTAEQCCLIAQAFPEDGRFLSDNLQRLIPAISLVSQTALFTAFINNVNPDMVYVQQKFGYEKPGDLLIGINTSGNSANVVNTCKIAKASGIHTSHLPERKKAN